MYQLIYKRLSKVFENIVFLTSNDSSDDEYCRLLEKIGINFFRGSLASPLLRTYEYLNHKPCRLFYRICGDSPLYPIDIVSDLEYQLNRDQCEDSFVTNVFPTRTWPKGWSIERIPALLVGKAIHSGTLAQSDHEHLTPWLYLHAHEYQIPIYLLQDLTANLNALRLVVDTETDYKALGLIGKEWFSPDYYMLRGSGRFLREFATLCDYGEGHIPIKLLPSSSYC